MKKSISFILAVVMIMAVMVTAIPVSAASDTYAADKEANAAIIRITTAADYQAFFDDITSSVWDGANSTPFTFDFSGKTVQLQNSIDFGGAALTVAGDIETWGTKGFNGEFDGQGYTLSNFVIEGAYTAHKVIALFPLTTNAAICNLTVENFTIKNTNTNYANRWNYKATAALVGLASEEIFIDNVTIKNGTVSNAAKASGDKPSYLGGVIGVHWYASDSEGMFASDITLTDSTVKDVALKPAGNTEVGGIIGCAYMTSGYAHKTAPTIDLTGSSIDVGKNEYNPLGGVSGSADWQANQQVKYILIGADGTQTGQVAAATDGTVGGLAKLADKCGAYIRLQGTYAADKEADASVLRITTVGDYKLFFQDITALDAVLNHFVGKTVQLQNDITFNDVTAANWYASVANKLETVGDSSGDWETAFFMGTFDGQGYTLTGVYADVCYGPRKSAGLFPKTQNATIKNLNINGIYIRNDLDKSTSWISGNQLYGAGALVGLAYDNLTVDNVKISGATVTNEANQTAKTSNLGGLIGVSYASSNNGFALKITNTELQGNVLVGSGTTSNAGAMLGGMRLDSSAALVGGVTIDITKSWFATNIVDTVGYVFNGFTADYTRQDAFKVIYGDKITTVTAAGTELPLTTATTKLNAAFYDAETALNVKLVGAQNRTDGTDGIRFIGAVKEYEDLEALGFEISIKKPGAEEFTKIDVSKTLVTKLYTEVTDVSKPTGFANGYLFTFSITGAIEEGTQFQVNVYSVDAIGTQTGASYLYPYPVQG